MLKYIIFIFSFAMFIIQTQQSINQLRFPEVIEASEMIPISDVEMPLITACVKPSYNMYGYALQNIFDDNKEVILDIFLMCHCKSVFLFLGFNPGLNKGNMIL